MLFHISKAWIVTMLHFTPTCSWLLQYKIEISTRSSRWASSRSGILNGSPQTKRKGIAYVVIVQVRRNTKDNVALEDYVTGDVHRGKQVVEETWVHRKSWCCTCGRRVMNITGGRDTKSWHKQSKKSKQMVELISVKNATSLKEAVAPTRPKV